MKQQLPAGDKTWHRRSFQDRYSTTGTILVVQESHGKGKKDEAHPTRDTGTTSDHGS
jgi:hypothetical protein